VIFQAEGSQNPLRPYERIDTLKQFIGHDTHVLRFWGVWDDSESLYGDLRNFVVHYFLSGKNNKRDFFFLKEMFSYLNNR
jgi:hypothetical protein